MIPSVFPAFPGRSEFDIFGKIITAHEVGGDFYDFCMVDDDLLYFSIGDAAGKGGAGGSLHGRKEDYDQGRRGEGAQA